MGKQRLRSPRLRSVSRRSKHSDTGNDEKMVAGLPGGSFVSLRRVHPSCVIRKFSTPSDSYCIDLVLFLLHLRSVRESLTNPRGSIEHRDGASYAWADGTLRYCSSLSTFMTGEEVGTKKSKCRAKLGPSKHTRSTARWDDLKHWANHNTPIPLGHRGR